MHAYHVSGFKNPHVCDFWPTRTYISPQEAIFENTCFFPPITCRPPITCENLRELARTCEDLGGLGGTREGLGPQSDKTNDKALDCENHYTMAMFRFRVRVRLGAGSDK